MKWMTWAGVIIRAVLVAAALFVAAGIALARADTVTVRGAHVLSPREVKSLLERAGGLGGRKALERVEEEYFRRGYMQAAVTARRAEPDSSWVVEVDEGQRASISRAAVAGLLSRSREDVIDFLGIGAGAPYRPARLESRIRALLAEYDEAGLPFAQVWVDSVGYDAASNTVALKFYVVEGGERVIRGVEIQGLEKTRPELAVRISGIQTGQPYRASVLREAYARLSASGVFTDVRYPTVEMLPDGTGVEVVAVVEEPKRAHTFVSAIGYAEAEGEEERQISGLVDLRLNNIGGTLRDLATMWSNDGRDRVETRIDYRDRFFLGRRLGVGVRLHQIGLDTLYTWQSLGVEVERTFGTVGVTVAVHGDRNVFSVGEVTRSWRARGALGVRFHRGGASGHSMDVLTRFTVARKRKVFRDRPDQTLAQYIAEVETDVVVALGRVLRARNALVYRGLESNEDVVPLSERFYIGGARTLRGYKENQFNGRRVATARTELLLGRTRAENVYVFGDVGYVLRENLTAQGNVERDEIVRAGYGFGLRTGSPLGNVDLSFGVGEKPSLQQTKVHVLLEQSF